MSFHGASNDPNEVYQYAYANHQPYSHTYLTENGMNHSEESNFWPSSPRSDSPSPNSVNTSPIVGPYQIYTPLSYANDHRHSPYRTGYGYPGHVSGEADMGLPTPFVRVVKRRTTANKKERRRTQSINNAYADLRECIPNVPADTKLSKIKTLRLATSYISYLTGVLETDDPAGGFRAELSNLSRKNNSNGQIQGNDCGVEMSTKQEPEERRSKGRTGWPQHVWALELKQEQGM